MRRPYSVGDVVIDVSPHPTNLYPNMRGRVVGLRPDVDLIEVDWINGPRGYRTLERPRASLHVIRSLSLADDYTVPITTLLDDLEAAEVALRRASLWQATQRLKD